MLQDKPCWCIGIGIGIGIGIDISIPGVLKTGLAKISTHSTTWQFKTTKLIQRSGSKLMVPRSIPTSPNLK